MLQEPHPINRCKTRARRSPDLFNTFSFSLSQLPPRAPSRANSENVDLSDLLATHAQCYHQDFSSSSLLLETETVLGRKITPKLMRSVNQLVVRFSSVVLKNNSNKEEIPNTCLAFVSGDLLCVACGNTDRSLIKRNHTIF